MQLELGVGRMLESVPLLIIEDTVLVAVMVAMRVDSTRTVAVVLPTEVEAAAVVTVWPSEVIVVSTTET